MNLTTLHGSAKVQKMTALTACFALFNGRSEIWQTIGAVKDGTLHFLHVLNFFSRDCTPRNTPRRGIAKSANGGVFAC